MDTETINNAPELIRQSGISYGTCMMAIGRVIARPDRDVQIYFDKNESDHLVEGTVDILNHIIAVNGMAHDPGLKGISVGIVEGADRPTVKISCNFFGMYVKGIGPDAIREPATSAQYTKLRDSLPHQLKLIFG